MTAPRTRSPTGSPRASWSSASRVACGWSPSPRGCCQVRLVAPGTAAHAAYPWLGDNALLTLTAAVDRILERYPVPAAEEWTTTVNVARIETTNTAVNQVPADATAWLDIRFPPEDAALHGRTRERDRRRPPGADRGRRGRSTSLAAPHHADPDCAEVKLLRRAGTVTCCASTAPRTAGSIPSAGSTRSSSGRAATASTARTSTPTSRRSGRTTVPL